MFAIKNFKKILSAFLTVSLLLGSTSFCIASVTKANESKSHKIAKRKKKSKEKTEKRNSWGIKEQVTSAVATVATVTIAGAYIYNKMTRPWNKTHDVGRLRESDIEFIENTIRGHVVANYSDALIRAAKYGADYYVIRLLEVIGQDIGQGTERAYNIINHREGENSSWTALMYALLHCKIDTIRALLVHDADLGLRSGDRPSTDNAFGLVNERLRYSGAVSHFGCGDVPATSPEQYYELLNLVVDRGYRFTYPGGGGILPENEKYGRSILRHLSGEIAEPDFRYCELCIRAGADVTVTDTEGRTPLVLAAQNDNVDVVNALVTYASNQITQEDKETAIAAAGENQDIVNLLNTLNPAQ